MFLSLMATSVAGYFTTMGPAGLLVHMESNETLSVIGIKSDEDYLVVTDSTLLEAAQDQGLGILSSEEQQKALDLFKAELAGISRPCCTSTYPPVPTVPDVTPSSSVSKPASESTPLHIFTPADSGTQSDTNKSFSVIATPVSGYAVTENSPYLLIQVDSTDAGNHTIIGIQDGQEYHAVIDEEILKIAREKGFCVPTGEEQQKVLAEYKAKLVTATSKAVPTESKIVYGVKLTPNDLVALLPIFPQWRQIITDFCGLKNEHGVTNVYHLPFGSDEDNNAYECSCDDCTGSFRRDFPQLHLLAKELNIGGNFGNAQVIDDHILRPLEHYGFHCVRGPSGLTQELIWGLRSPHFYLDAPMTDQEFLENLAEKETIKALAKIRMLGWRVHDTGLWKDPQIYRL